MCEELVAGGVLPLALEVLQGSNEEIQAKGAELVAELAKVTDYHSLSVSIRCFHVFRQIHQVLMFSVYDHKNQGKVN